MLEKLFYKKQVILMYIYPLFDPVESAEHDLNVGEDEHVADDLGSISSTFFDQLLHNADPKSAKNTVKLSIAFVDKSP